MLASGFWGCATDQPQRRVVNTPALAAAPAPEPEATLNGDDSGPHLQLRLAERALMSGAVDIRPEDRLDAARLLLSLDSPESAQVLAKALRSGTEPIVAAVAGAMDTSQHHPPTLLNPLVHALMEAPERQWDLLGRVAARYGEEAESQISRLALDRVRPQTQRLAAIHALGAALSPRAAQMLISILSNPAGDPPLIIDAVCTSLERMTGIQQARDPQLWLQWWQASRDKSPEEWQSLYVQSLQARLGQLQSQLQQQRAARSEAASRLIDALRELFVHLPASQQLSRLPALLSDPMPEVREFAFSRIEQRQRDNEPIPEEIQKKLIERLDDSVPRFRARAAQQLDLANHPEVTGVLIERLPMQTDPDVVAPWMGILAKRAAADAFEPAISRMSVRSTPAVVDASVGVIWSLLETGALDEEQRQWAAEASRQVLTKLRSPPLLRLLAAIGNEQEGQELLGELRSTDAATRAAVAQGLAYRGWVDALTKHASDPAIYPHVLKLTASKPGDWAMVPALVSLQPPAPDMAVRWQQAVLRVAAEQPVDRLVAMDDLLAAAPWAEKTMRAEAMRRGLDAPPDALPDDARTQLLFRLASLYDETGQVVQAHEALQRLPNVQLTPEQKRTRLFVALRAGSYDRAFELDPSPEAWVQCFTSLTDRNPAAAQALKEEIKRRFGSSLNGMARERFESAAARIESQLAWPRESSNQSTP